MADKTSLSCLGSVFSPVIAILVNGYFVLRCDNRLAMEDAAATLSLVAGIAFYCLIKLQELPIGPTLTTIVFTTALHYTVRRWGRWGKNAGGVHVEG